jgi:hypothetical protein
MIYVYPHYMMTVPAYIGLIIKMIKLTNFNILSSVKMEHLIKDRDRKWNI